MIRWKYALATLVLLGTEIAIALFVHDQLVRPFVGDVLVVVLIYCFLRIFVPGGPRPVALGVLLFSCGIEVLQYFDYVALLHLEHNRVLSTMLGRTFSWSDFLAYFTGCGLILAIDRPARPSPVLQSGEQSGPCPAARSGSRWETGG